MAHRSEKKRVVREKTVGRYYTLSFAFSLVFWLFKLARDFYRGSFTHTKFGFFWRASLVFLGYTLSLYSIYNNLRLGLDFSLSNDLFIVTTASTVLSVFSDHAYKLFLLVPLYGTYKGSVALYKWATAPPSEVPNQPEPQETKKRYKYRTVRS